jgi:sulfate adenylyltransferase
VVVFFTGLSGAGKSTTANILRKRLLETGERDVVLLDGDIVRKQFSPELGFSKEDRDRNIHRISLLAREIAGRGGVAICAQIAPYDRARKEVRALIEESGSEFLLVYLATPLAVCERRDCKGLYAQARAGRITNFTGISDPYEIPTDAKLVIDTTNLAPDDAARQITRRLEHERHLMLALRSSQDTGDESPVTP